MRSLAILCILCLVVVCAVSTATISQGMAPGIKVLTTIDPHEISVNQPRTTLMGLLSVTSTPSGATVLIDGLSTVNGVPIPVTDFSSLAIVSGSHSMTVKHTGYLDYSATFSVSPGGTTSVPVQLSPLNVRANQLNSVVAGGAVARNIEVQAIAANPPSTMVPSPTPTLLPCPSGYTCESLAKAQSDYGAGGYSQYGNLPCNYTGRALSKEQVKEYCIRPDRKALERITLKTVVIAPAGEGQAGFYCPAGFESYTVCSDNYCYDLTSDPTHCGTCDKACSSGQTCTRGVCTDGGGTNPPIHPLPPVPEGQAVGTAGSQDTFLSPLIRIFIPVGGNKSPAPSAISASAQNRGILESILSIFSPLKNEQLGCTRDTDCPAHFTCVQDKCGKEFLSATADKVTAVWGDTVNIKGVETSNQFSPVCMNLFGPGLPADGWVLANAIQPSTDGTWNYPWDTSMPLAPHYTYQAGTYTIRSHFGSCDIDNYVKTGISFTVKPVVANQTCIRDTDCPITYYCYRETGTCQEEYLSATVSPNTAAWGDPVTVTGDDHTHYHKVCLQLKGPALPGDGVFLACPDSIFSSYNGHYLINYTWDTSQPLPSGYPKNTGTYTIWVYHYDYAHYTKVAVNMADNNTVVKPNP